MGCDIHAYREVKRDGCWVSADEWEGYDYGEGDAGNRIPWEKRPYAGRNYQLFGILAEGVRSEHTFAFALRGKPLVCSLEVLDELANEDGHSYSYLYLHELKELRNYLNATSIAVTGMKDPGELAALNATIAAGNPNWDLLFPYCGWTSRTDAVEFTLDVPASFYVGKDLDTIISSFDGIEGDEPRLVFYFDN